MQKVLNTGCRLESLRGGGGDQIKHSPETQTKKKVYAPVIMWDRVAETVNSQVSS